MVSEIGISQLSGSYYRYMCESVYACQIKLKRKVCARSRKRFLEWLDTYRVYDKNVPRDGGREIDCVKKMERKSGRK